MSKWPAYKPCTFDRRQQTCDQQGKTSFRKMYSRGFSYNRPPYPIGPHESRAPPPLSHPPYVYSSPSRTYPTAGSYPASNSSRSYSHIPPQQLTHYVDPRYVDVSPRDEVPTLHHLPHQPSAMPELPEHSHQSMESAAQLLPSCEQGNDTIQCYFWCLSKIIPFCWCY